MVSISNKINLAFIFTFYALSQNMDGKMGFLFIEIYSKTLISVFQILLSTTIKLQPPHSLLSSFPK